LGVCDVGGLVLLGDCVRVVLVGKVDVTFSAAVVGDDVDSVVGELEGTFDETLSPVTFVGFGARDGAAEIDCATVVGAIDSTLWERDGAGEINCATAVGAIDSTLWERDGAGEINCATAVGAIDSTLWDVAFVSLFILLGKEGSVSFPLLDKLVELGARDGGADDGGVGVSNSVDELSGDNSVVVF